MVRSSTIVNAIIGAVIGVVLSFIPFSTVLGGAAAGFLEGPNERAATTAGALAGVITFLPVLGMSFLVFGFLGLGLAGGAPGSGIAFFLILILGFLFFILVYTVGLSALGGYLGAYLAREYPDRQRRTRDTIGFETDPERPSRSPDTVSTRDRGVDTTSPGGRDTDTMSTRDRDADPDRSESSEFEGDRHSERDRDRESDLE